MKQRNGIGKRQYGGWWRDLSNRHDPNAHWTPSNIALVKQRTNRRERRLAKLRIRRGDE